MNAVEINNLSFRYKDAKKNVLDNVNLIVKQGEILAITGRSGCGKSTVCNCICGLIPRVYEGEYEGEVRLFDKKIDLMDIKEITTSVGIIFQNPATQLFSPTIEDELSFGPENLCVDRDEIGRRIDDVLKIINMQRYRFQNPNKLSGGQQQLIAMASVLVMQPKVLICDEIMSWIDEDGKKIIRDLLFKLKEEGKTIIMIDHDKENIQIADRIVEM